MRTRSHDFVAVLALAGGAVFADAACMHCPEGEFPDGFKCRTHDCPVGTKPDVLMDNSIQCMCPAGKSWSGQQCVGVCPEGQTWGATGNCCRAMTGSGVDINSCAYTPPPNYNVAVAAHRYAERRRR